MEVTTSCATTADISCKLWTRDDLTSWTRANIFWFLPAGEGVIGYHSEVDRFKLLPELGLKEPGQVNYVHVSYVLWRGMC